MNPTKTSFGLENALTRGGYMYTSNLYNLFHIFKNKNRTVQIQSDKNEFWFGKCSHSRISNLSSYSFLFFKTKKNS
jgi:hypothetical protein